MKTNPAANQPAAPGFTLIELLTVITIISVLAAMLLPALSKAKQKGQQAGCISNPRQMTIAEMLYSGDNNGYFVPNNGDVRGPVATAKGLQSWANGFLTLGNSPFTKNSGPNNYDNINTELFMNPEYSENKGRAGLLGVYLGNPKLLRCQADKSQAIIWERLHNRVRSYSMNSALGGKSINHDYLGWEPYQRVFRKFV